MNGHGTNGDRPKQSVYPNQEQSSEEGSEREHGKRPRKSGFTLPRSWSFWRLKGSSNYSVASSDPDGQARMTPDDRSQSSEKPRLRRTNSFKALMKKFRKYKSTESLQGNRRKAKSPAEVRYLEEMPGKITVPVLGLQNHGNSCYINAVMQCLNNTARIYQFFVSGAYKTALAQRNRDNARKHGTNGNLTLACGELIRSLGRASYQPSVSEGLIRTVAKYWNEFHDGCEQDAQEFLLWLLDKMHEDLSTGRKKKLKNRKTAIPDDYLAAYTEKASGSSFISRLYHALFRSSITCRQCGQQSNTFDPFVCLSLPLPQVDMKPLFIQFVPMNNQAEIVRYGFSTSIDCCIKDVKQLVGQKTRTRPDELLMIELNEDGFQKTLFNDETSDALQETQNDLYAIELSKLTVPTAEREELFIVLLHVVKEGDKVQKLSAPRVVCLPRESTYDDLEVEIITNLKTMQSIGPSEYIYERVAEPLPHKPFRISLADRNEYLSSSVDHPFYMETVEECLSLSQNVSAYPHLKVYVEWELDAVSHLRTWLLKESYSDDASVAQTKSLPQNNSKTTLSDCLDLYMQNEQIGLDGPWECPNCGALQSGVTKKQTLWTLPEILVIHLKRFRQSSSTRFKLTSMVDFPMEHLDMGRYLTQPDDLDPDVRIRNGYVRKTSWFGVPKARKPPGSQLDQMNTYSLFGVVNHQGKLNSGHYTAYCRHPSDGKWYLYDDLKVKNVDEPSEVVTKDAYLLFYQRDPLGTHPELYYDDFAQARYIPSYRSSPALRSRSAENIANDDEPQEDDAKLPADPNLTRTAQLYASLPRQPRRTPVVHQATPSGAELPEGHSNRAAPNEHYYERHRAIPVTITDCPIQNTYVPTPRLHRPVQESCV